MATASILPCEVVSNVASFYVQLSDLVLFTSATFKVVSLDANGTALKTDYLVMNTDEYQQWNSDDTFVFSFIANKLGYTLTNPPAVPVPAPVSSQTVLISEASNVFTVPSIILS
jgi:hypothetical protein